MAGRAERKSSAPVMRLEMETAPGDTISLRLLAQDAFPATEVADWLARFIAQAQTSLHLAFYDCRLSPAPAGIIREALGARIAAGVDVRLIYDAGDKPQSMADVEERGTDLAPPDTHDRVAELGLPPDRIRAVHGIRTLMHHKYMIRDGATVWTGSTNLTDDSMSRMENLILTLDAIELATLYDRDFNQLWETGSITGSGAFPTSPTTLQYGGRPAPTDVDFSPGQGEAINAWVARRVAAARQRIVICSMLVNSSRLVRALIAQLERGVVEISGLYDRTQMQGVVQQWRGESQLGWKVAAVERLFRDANLVGKVTRPYRPAAPHDFMHNKTLVIDDTVITGSYNFSHSAQDNAENILLIQNPPLAERIVTYTEELADRYRSAPRHGARSP